MSKKLVRICDVEEYSAKIKDDNLTEMEMFFIFFITSFFSLISIELEKLFCGYGVEMSFSFTFASITVLYNVSNLTKSSFKKGYKSYDAQVYYLSFLISFLFSVIFLIKFDDIIDLDIKYDAILNIVNDRITRVTTYQNNIPKEVFLFDKLHLKILFSLIFSYYICGIFTVCTRVAYFDILLLQTEEKLKRSYMIKDNSVIRSYRNYSKIRLIYHFFILFLLIDPLFKSLLTKELKIVNEVTYYTTIVFTNILMEVFLMTKTTRFSSKLFFEQNCYEMIEFAENPQKGELDRLRRKMHSMNIKGFEIFSQFVYIVLLPLILMLLFFNRSGCSEEMNNILFSNQNLTNSTINNNVLQNNSSTEWTKNSTIKDLNAFTFKNSFIETICYFLLIANYFAKSFFTLIYSYYLSNFSRHGKMYLI